MGATAIQFYELAGEDPELRFSPHCWKTRMALAHKGVEAERIPWRYSEKERIAFTGQGSVPVIRHGDIAVSDSWKIALYLEGSFPDRPALFGGADAVPIVQFVNAWVDSVLLPAAARVVMLETHNLMRPADQVYFRSTREKKFGMSLEQLVVDRPARIAHLRQELVPLRHMLTKQAFIGGNRPMYADYCVFGMFMWVRCTSSAELIEPGDSLAPWIERLLREFGGLALNAPRAGARSRLKTVARA